MRPQEFEFVWEKQKDGCTYNSTRDICHALGNSDQYPFPIGAQPKTPEEEMILQIQTETLNAVVAAIEAAPEYHWENGTLRKETNEERNARLRQIEERGKGYAEARERWVAKIREAAK